jgi:hypothetical protein
LRARGQASTRWLPARAAWLPGLLWTCLALPLAAPVAAQGIAWEEDGQRIESVEIRVTGLEGDPRREALLVDRVRRTLGLYPTGEFDRFFAEANLGRLRRLPGIEAASYAVRGGPAGGVVVEVDVTATAGTAAAGAPAAPASRGLLVPGSDAGLPTLYERDDTLLKFGLTSAVNFNFNDDAWYGRPGPLLDGNPLVNGPPGRGSFTERSAFFDAGLYGITPVTDAVYVYGGASYLVSGSTGQDLFESRDRLHGAFEDAYAGMVGGFTRENGERLTWNVSGGRKKFSIGDGFLVGATSGSGSGRAMINYSPRWAADRLWLAEARWNIVRAQLFSIDPDELPEIDTSTRVRGANVEVQWTPRLLLAATHLRVPESEQRYFLADFSARSREGLRVYGARFEWQPPPARPGPLLRGEYAQQRHADFAMRAVGGWLQAGWSFADTRWKPLLSYRYASLSGDDPRTARYERWDPLLMGISPWDWVQGMNHGKVFGNANRISHRLQVEIRPRPDVQLISQYWEFRADERNNIGGLGVVTTLASTDLGSEVNLMGRWFFRRNAFFQAQVALTQPGAALSTALGGPIEKPWVFFNTFVRVSF